MAGQDSTSNTFVRGRPSTLKGKRVLSRSPYAYPKMVFYHLMLVPRGYRSPYFKGKEITTFLKALNRCFKDYKINNNKEKKECVTKYLAKHFKKDIKQLLEYRDSTSQEDFQKTLLKEYYYTDLDQLLHTISYLKKYVKDFKSLVENRHITQAQIHDYYRGFYKIRTKCKDSNNITKKALTFKFLYTLPQNLKIKAM